MSSVTLVLGGTRSGKSGVAELLVSDLQAELDVAVTYVATAFHSDDPDHRARIEAHRSRRPDEWITVECPDPDRLPAALSDADGVVLLDSLGTWVSAHDDLRSVDVVPVVNAVIGRGLPTVIVSDEVGLAVHAPTELGRAFVDAMGTVNQQVAAVAERAVLVVAGRVIELPAP